MKKIVGFFVWDELKDDVLTFCKEYIHCQASNGSMRVPRPMANTVHALLPNELLHMDFLYIGRSMSGQCYILIIKDDLSSYVWLVPCVAADSRAALKNLFDWLTTFGLPGTFVPDQAKHFMNNLLEMLASELKCHQSITTAYSPWANGSVEVVYRQVLNAMRKLCAEFRLGFDQWPRLVPIVQSILNNSSSSKLGGRAPIKVFTQLSPENPMLSLQTQEEPVQFKSNDKIRAQQIVNLAEIQNGLSQMHREVKQSADRLRAKDGRTTHVRNVLKCSFTSTSSGTQKTIASRSLNLGRRWI